MLPLHFDTPRQLMPHGGPRLQALNAAKKAIVLMSPCRPTMEVDARDVATARSHQQPHRAHRSLLRAHWLRFCAVTITVLAVAPSGTVWHSRSGVLVRRPQLQRPRMSGKVRAPEALQKATSFSSACGVHRDPYGWLRDDSRTDPQVLSHLRAENAYAAAQLASIAPLQQRLHQELQASLPSVQLLPLKAHAGWLYYEQRAQGQQYADIVRVPSPAGGSATHSRSCCNKLMAWCTMYCQTWPAHLPSHCPSTTRSHTVSSRVHVYAVQWEGGGGGGGQQTLPCCNCTSGCCLWLHMTTAQGCLQTHSPHLQTSQLWLRCCRWQRRLCSAGGPTVSRGNTNTSSSCTT
jgi:hypothetical protein